MHNSTLKSKRFRLALLAAVLSLTVGGGLDKGQDRSALAREQPEPKMVALFDRPEIKDPDVRALREIRDQHAARFTFGMPSLDQVGGGGTTDCYAPGVREKLAVEKDTVLITGVVDAKVYLNPTKQHVYTEYRVVVEQVIKSDDAQLGAGKEIITNRWGGAVQFPSGEVREYWVRKLGMPEVGQRYLFFLEEHKEGRDYYIWTAFRLGAGPIVPLDHLDSKLLPLAAYSGSNEVEFLAKVRKAVAATRKAATPKRK